MPLPVGSSGPAWQAEQSFSQAAWTEWIGPGEAASFQYPDAQAARPEASDRQQVEQQAHTPHDRQRRADRLAPEERVDGQAGARWKVARGAHADQRDPHAARPHLVDQCADVRLGGLGLELERR